MGLNIGIITVRDHDYHPNRRLGEAASEQGHRVSLVHPYRVWPALENGDLYLIGQPKMEALDVVLPRQGATVGESCLTLIRHFSLMGIPVVNNLTSISVAKNQFLTLLALAEAQIPFPDTLFVNSAEGLDLAISRLGDYPVVAKQVSGRQGEGVMLVKTHHDLQSIISGQLDSRKGLLLQRFIPTERRQDIRVLVLGGKVVGAMELRPKEGEFRANFHISGESRAIDLPTELERNALQAANAVDLEIAGVDLILDHDAAVYVIEVNYSPGFRGLESATGLDIAGKIVNYLASTYGERSH